MVEFFRRIAANDELIKLIFDHLRNTTIVAVIFAAAVWRYNALSFDNLWLVILDTTSVVVIALFAAGLLFVNIFHLKAKLRSLKVNERVLSTFGSIYGLVIAAIIFSLTNL